MAFAVENVRTALPNPNPDPNQVRTALEGGAAHVTVVARRLGTICPKVRVRAKA